MNCQQFWKTLPENGTAHPHLDECPACAARMQRRQQLASGMRAMADSMARAQAPSRVESRLLAAFRSHAGTAAMAPRRRWIPVATWAAAFAAMIGVGIFLVRNRAPEAEQPLPARHVELALSDPGNALDAAMEEGFLPLPGAAQLSASDDMNVVHVELPRSAMMQVGIEVTPEDADETVLADVMVGSDGLARAVRFVTGSD